MTSTLEREYRQLLQWYPRSWRTARADDMLGTFLDVAESENRTRPGVGERVSIAFHGLAAHLERYVPAKVRDLSSTLALASGFGAALVTFVFSSWAPWAGMPSVVTSGAASMFGPFRDMGPLLEAFWAVAFVAAGVGHWRVGRAALAASIVIALMMPQWAMFVHPQWNSVDRLSLTFSAAVAALAVFGTPLRGRALSVPTAAWMLLLFLGYAAHRGLTPDWQPTASLWSAAGSVWYVSMAALVMAAVTAMARRWTVASVLVLVLLPWTATLYRGSISGILVGLNPGAMILGVLEVAAVLAIAIHSVRSTNVRTGDTNTLGTL